MGTIIWNKYFAMGSSYTKSILTLKYMNKLIIHRSCFYRVRVCSIIILDLKICQLSSTRFTFYCVIFSYIFHISYFSPFFIIQSEN